jgi:hypothetical protein
MPNLITSIDLSLLPGQASDGMDTANDSSTMRRTQTGKAGSIFF